MPAENLVGNVGDGFATILSSMNAERVSAPTHARAHMAAAALIAVPSWLAAAMARLVATVRCCTTHGAEDWAPSAHGAAPRATGSVQREDFKALLRATESITAESEWDDVKAVHATPHARTRTRTIRRCMATRRSRREGVWQCCGYCAAAAGGALSRCEVLCCALRAAVCNQP